MNFIKVIQKYICFQIITWLWTNRMKIPNQGILMIYLFDLYNLYRAWINNSQISASSYIIMMRLRWSTQQKHPLVANIPLCEFNIRFLDLLPIKWLSFASEKRHLLLKFNWCCYTIIRIQLMIDWIKFSNRWNNTNNSLVE